MKRFRTKNIQLRENPLEYLTEQEALSRARAKAWTEKRIAFEDKHPNEINKIYSFTPVVGALLIGAAIWGMK